MRARRRVVVFGVFDLPHPGHLAFLAAARRLGTELVAVVTRDARVKAEKGHLPVLDERERLSMVGALRPVDRAVLGDRPGTDRILLALRPAIVAIGYDQRVPKTARGPWRIVRIAAKDPKRYRATRIRAVLDRLAKS